jgi:hypothetical protein
MNYYTRKSRKRQVLLGWVWRSLGVAGWALALQTGVVAAEGNCKESESVVQ